MAYTARIPAWKRLGLQLKNQNAPESKKRNFDDSFSNEKPEIIQDQNRHKEERSTISSGSASSKKRKSVAFSHDTKLDDGNDTQQQLRNFIAQNTGGEDGFLKSDAAEFVQTSVFDRSQASEPQPRSQETRKQPKSKKSQKVQKTQKNLDSQLKGGGRAEKGSEFFNEGSPPAYVDYLITFHTQRDKWKFNKNNQTSVLRHLFDLTKLPATLNPAIYAYIRGLKGEIARQRVRETAQAVLKESDSDLQDTNQDQTMESTDEERMRTFQEREAAANREVFNAKIRKRELDDKEVSETNEFQLRKARHQRAQYVLRQLKEAAQNMTPQDQQKVNHEAHKPPATMSNRLMGPYSTITGKITFDDDGLPVERRVLRKKLVTIGAQDDDISSISSVGSDSVATSSSESDGSSSDEETSESSSDKEEDEHAVRRSANNTVPAIRKTRTVVTVSDSSDSESDTSDDSD